MSEETLDLNQGADIDPGNGFVIHPAGYEGPVHCSELKFQEDAATKQITAIILKLDCDGANVQEFISLKTTERYTLEIIKSKIAKVLVSFGIRKVGEKSPKLMDDIKRVQGGWGHARLKIDKYQIKTGLRAGEWMEGNKIEYFLSAEEFETRKKAASGLPTAAQSAHSPAPAPAPKKFNFG